MKPGFKTMLADCRVGIVGLGLMGGSLALALRAARVCRSLIGYDLDPHTIDQALERGVIERPIDLAGDEVDLLILATPVSAILAWLQRAPAIVANAFHLIDLGSTKTRIAGQMQQLPDRISPLGGHPMCGKETSGLDVADGALFRRCLFVLTPLERTHVSTLAVAQELIGVLEARALILEPARHDQVAALISHAPYLAAAALVDAAQQADDDLAWTMASTGFRDSTRLAASDVTMMLDTITSNQAAVLAALTRLQASLQDLSDLIEHDRHAELRSLLESVRARRVTMYR